MRKVGGISIVLAAALFGVMCLGSGISSLPVAPQSAQTPASDVGKKTLVVVELFTSEGCSDCPPADALLTRLHQMQPVPGAEIIALEEHVDYWDQQGWADPFSSAVLTRRQNDYAYAFRNSGVYTPQMVVDGRVEFVGSREGAARQAVAEAARAPKTAVHLRVTTGGDKAAAPLEVRIERLVGATPGDRADVFLAITEGRLHSDVAGGENSGRKLDHEGVVRRLERLGRADARADTAFAGQTAVKFSPGWNRANLRAVVFLQEQRSRHILGAAGIPLN